MEKLCDKVMRNEFYKRKAASEYGNTKVGRARIKRQLDEAFKLKEAEHQTERIYAEFQGFCDGAHGKINLNISVFNYNIILSEGYRAGYELATKKSKGEDLEKVRNNIKEISDRIEGARYHQLDWIMERP